MRTITKLILTAGIATGGIFAYSKLYKDGQCKLDQSTFQTTHPTYKTIVRKKVFSGNLIPHQEVKVESHVTGIVDKLLVKVGDHVQKGATIARIKVRPNPKEVEAAKSKLRLQSIALNQTRSKYLRSKQLFNKKMLAKEAYEAELAIWEQTKEKFASAQKELQIIQLGHTTATKSSSANSLNATIKGTILELPIKEGSMVQGTNEKVSATTVAVIGNMDRLLFSAKISELDVVHLKKGMTFTASLNAFHEETFQVTLTKISPKANEEALKKGEIKFEIEGIVHKPKKSKVLLRAGYLALAKVVLERAEHVLAIPESVIHTEDKNYFVKCLSDGREVKKDVVLGLSDGLYVEVKEGLTETDLLIVEA